jgi:hypothetical protein
MDIKITMKIGEDEHVMSEDEMKMFNTNPEGMEKIIQAKGMMSALTAMIDMNPQYRGKRIEMITEFGS